MSKRWVDLVDSNAFNLLGGVTALYGSKFDDLLGCVNEADRIRTPQSFSDYVLCILFAPHHFLQLGCMGCDNNSCFAPNHENAHHCLSLAAHPNSFVCQIRPASDFADLTALEDFDTSVFDSKHPISRGWGYWSEDALVISNHNYTRGSKDLSHATLISLMEESLLSLHRSLYGPEPTAHLHDSRTSGYALSIWGVYVNYDYSRVYAPSPIPTDAMGHPTSPLFSKDTAVPHFTVSRSHLCKFTTLTDELIDDCTWDDLVGESACCDDCGDRFDHDDLASVGDCHYCSNCMECFRWSEWNEEWIHEDDAVYSSLEGDYFWTHQVVEDYQGEYIRADNAVETNNGQTVHCDDDTLVRLDYGQGRLLLDDDNLVQSVIGGSLDRDHPQTVELPDGEYCHQNDIDTGRVILCEDDDGEETYKISNAKVAI
jgi:hypothetical protein